MAEEVHLQIDGYRELEGVREERRGEKRRGEERKGMERGG